MNPLCIYTEFGVVLEQGEDCVGQTPVCVPRMHGTRQHPTLSFGRIISVPA